MRAFLFRTGAVVALLSLAWSTPSAAQHHGGRGGGGRGRTVVVAPAWGPGWWGPSFYWGSPYWWGAWGPTPLGFWPYVDPAYLRSQSMSSVRVQVQPKETEVFVDGYLAGVADQFDGVFQRLRVPPGAHVLELYLPGHQPVRQDLMLAPGESYKIQYTMQPLAEGESEPTRPQPLTAPTAPAIQPPTGLEAPPSTLTVQAPASPATQGLGRLVVRAQPADAEIAIDGEAWHGTGDRLTVDLPLGPHRVDVQKGGFNAFSTTVEIVPGPPVVLNVSLLREEDQASSRVQR